ncbi:uncharacterized protein LOC100169131 [Acyrthosiphon pisum]|uniref:DUF4806 domain-containing protein n=1 Tax=Acyrthosiphon pisum TaxID=7029 RepID=A0A8R2H907_ACYPI|nr:uncharacterized protein LOC100169131 [Acyrthosiphon pisum]|eukprot:XP_016664431.1 PREDICTED: uncharacterized protein LOC100169131 [Acyrthosiphon pisum]
MNYLKLELTSFIENKEASTLKNNTFNQEKADDILSTFPINDEEKLLALESKLTTYDPGYNDKLVSAFMFASEGKSISKVTNSLLRTIFTDTFASDYSWKGQKEKKKLENYKIFKVIINCVGKKFPNSENYKMDVIASVMNWFAQAPTRILRDEKGIKNLKKRICQQDNHRHLKMMIIHYNSYNIIFYYITIILFPGKSN